MQYINRPHLLSVFIYISTTAIAEQQFEKKIAEQVSVNMCIAS